MISKILAKSKKNSIAPAPIAIAPSPVLQKAVAPAPVAIPAPVMALPQKTAVVSIPVAAPVAAAPLLVQK